MTRVEIRKKATGQVRDCSDNFEDNFDFLPGKKLTEAPLTLFCDCDRQYHFDRFVGGKCGHSRFSVRLTAPDGTRIYSDFAEDQ